MEKKHQVHNLIILDESGSMGTIKHNIIQGFNELVQTINGIEKQFPDQEHFITFISFNGLGQKLLHFADPASRLQEINDKSYHPAASTPLYDAMGFGISKLKQQLQNHTDYNVLVTVLTDGAENASREYRGSSIKQLVEELKQNNWTFTYIGTDHDVVKFAGSLAIDNVMAFKKDAHGISDMFQKDRKARAMFSDKLNRKMDVTMDFFSSNDLS
jgi:hypothetical protein